MRSKTAFSISQLIDYADVIPFEESEALTSRELEHLWGCSGRDVRLIVSAIRANFVGGGMLIGSNSGYYLTTDTVKIRDWIKRSRSHCLSVEKAISDAEYMLGVLESWS